MKITGTVIHGKGEGRKLGFPTANFVLGEKVESGVYGGTAWFYGKEYKAGIFVHEAQKVLEAHFLDFDGDLYDKEIEVEIKEKIRDNLPYIDEVQMKKQIVEDVNKVRFSK